jgi:hypothetical protein
MFSALPFLMSVANSCYLSWHPAIFDFFRRLSRLFLGMVKFLVTGNVKDNGLPFNAMQLPTRGASVSVLFPKFSLQLTESPTHSPRQSPPEEPQEPQGPRGPHEPHAPQEPQEPEEAIAGPSNPPVHPERQPKESVVDEQQRYLVA